MNSKQIYRGELCGFTTRYSGIVRRITTFLSIITIFLTTALVSTSQALAREGDVQLQRNWNIEALLSKAERAVSANRLYAPSSDNALDYIQEVLSIAPENKQARSMLREVTDRVAGLPEAGSNVQPATSSRVKDIESPCSCEGEWAQREAALREVPRFRTYWTF